MSGSFTSVTIPPRIPHGLDEIIAAYGDPKLHAGAVDARWEATNMVVMHGLPLVPAQGKHPPGVLYVHKALALPLQLALADCERIGGYVLRTIGCFSPRFKAAIDGEPSVHTWGCAVDLNASANRLITHCPLGDWRRTAPTSCDIPPAWIAAFKARGFVWGGDFTSRFDPMHFQLCSGY